MEHTLSDHLESVNSMCRICSGKLLSSHQKKVGHLRKSKEVVDFSDILNSLDIDFDNDDVNKHSRYVCRLRAAGINNVADRMRFLMSAHITSTCPLIFKSTSWYYLHARPADGSECVLRARPWSSCGHGWSLLRPKQRAVTWRAPSLPIPPCSPPPTPRLQQALDPPSENALAPSALCPITGHRPLPIVKV